MMVGYAKLLLMRCGTLRNAVPSVEIKGVDFPEVMQRAMARQAEAEREKRAKVIHAQGEFEASEQLAAAAHTLSDQPIAIQLRYLQTLTEIGMEKNTTIVFPIPIDFLKYFVNREGPHPMTLQPHFDPRRQRSRQEIER